MRESRAQARPATVIERSTTIDAPIESVFEFVADARNDPLWCPRVVWCEQREGERPGLGARYEAFHRPTFQRRHHRWIDVVEFAPPERMVSTQEDEIALFTITYSLEPAASGTRLTQRDEIAWKIQRVFVPFGRRVVRRHIGDQLESLKRLLESRTAAPLAAEPAL
jgi:uncharacterized protein YndB with AHSA1/START domain